MSSRNEKKRFFFIKTHFRHVIFPAKKGQILNLSSQGDTKASKESVGGRRTFCGEVKGKCIAFSFGKEHFFQMYGIYIYMVNV